MDKSYRDTYVHLDPEYFENLRLRSPWTTGFNPVLLFDVNYLQYYTWADGYQGVLFLYIFLVIFILISAFMVFVTKNPVVSVLYLVLTFLNTSFLMLLLEVEYLGLIFIIVYVGAISMLFLFIVMMLDIRRDNLVSSGINLDPLYIFFGFFLLVFVFFELYLLLVDSFNNLVHTSRVFDETVFLSPEPLKASLDSYLNLKEYLFYRLGFDNIGHFIYTHYFVYFYIIGFILLLPMIGAIVLTNNESYRFWFKN